MVHFLKRPSITSLLVFLGLNSLIFGSGFYAQYLEPNSSAGNFLLRKRHIAINAAQSTKPKIAMLGDSRMSEGFSAKVFDSALDQYSAINLAVPGSSLRVWYYFLEQVDKHNNSFAAVLIPLPSYCSKGIDSDPINREVDLNFLLPTSKISQIFDLATTFDDSHLILKTLLAALLPVVSFQDDLHAFAINPAKRIADVEDTAACKIIMDYFYKGREGSLENIKFSGHQLISMPPNVASDIKERIAQKLAAGQAKEASTKQIAYSKYWLERIADKYKGLNTKVILVKIPTNPLVPDPKDEMPNSTIKKLVAQKSVLIVDGHAFSYLEKPIYFFDDLHMNKTGREIFSKDLALAISKILNKNGDAAEQLSAASHLY